MLLAWRFFGTDDYGNQWILEVLASSENEARQRIRKSGYSDIEWELVPKTFGGECDLMLD